MIMQWWKKDGEMSLIIEWDENWWEKILSE